MNQEQHIQIRISSEDKEIVREIFSEMGLSLSGGIKLFLKKVVQQGKIPFDITAVKKKKTLRIPKKKVAPLPKETETTDTWNGFQKRTIGS